MRERLSFLTLKQEARSVLIFSLHYMAYSPKSKIKVSDAYKEYQVWADMRGLGSKLSIDGFGRLLPKSLKRKTLCRQGETSRYIMDRELCNG